MLRIVLLVVLVAAYPVIRTASAVQAGDPAPVWEARDLDGNALRFPVPGAGHTTVLVFWATWCPYCQVFMPHLAEIESDYRDRGVRVLAINCKEEGREKEGDPVAYLRSLEESLIKQAFPT